MSSFNEHSLEMAIMELFEQQGYSTHEGSLKLQDGGWRVLPQGSHFKKGSPAERTWGHDLF
jgi:hypothetical protein